MRHTTKQHKMTGSTPRTSVCFRFSFRLRVFRLWCRDLKKDVASGPSTESIRSTRDEYHRREHGRYMPGLGRAHAHRRGHILRRAAHRSAVQGGGGGGDNEGEQGQRGGLGRGANKAIDGMREAGHHKASELTCWRNIAGSTRSVDVHTASNRRGARHSRRPASGEAP